MAKLRAEIVTFVVTRLACFEKPKEVQDAVKEAFGLELTLPQIMYYDPTTSGTDVGKRWRRLFTTTRARCLKDTADIPIAHRTVRLRELQKLYDKDKNRGATALAREHLEQAAKEMGDAFTNRRLMLPGDTDSLAAELGKLLGVEKDDLLATFAGANA